MSYDKTIVKKPWGYEYLAYENDKVGLWFLYIAKDQQTSMHCHPNKTTGLVLLDGEVEVSFLGPVDKHDLVRLEDKYGREGKPYEDSTFETPKQEDCLWIEDKAADYNFANCNIKVEKISDIDVLNQKEDDENIMFLDGGILTDDKFWVVQAGDIVSGKIVKKLIKLFPTIDNDTMFMTIRKSDD
jgi:hypothetical protein